MQRAPGLRAGEKKIECEYPNGHMDHFGDEISVVLHAKQLNVMPHFYSPQHTRITSIYMVRPPIGLLAHGVLVFIVLFRL